MRLGRIGTADGGAAVRYPGDVWHYTRTRTVVACRAAGINAIDGPRSTSPTRRAMRPAGYEKSPATFSMLAGVGKWCIHPSQIEVANQVFAPTPEEIAEAQAVIDAADQAEAQGQGATTYEGLMIEAATTRLFEATLDRARQCGLV